MSPESLVAVKEHFKTLKPNYKVELIVKGKSHLYKVTQQDGKESILPGVTGVLGIIAKPALVNWAKKEALAVVRAGLLHRLGGKASKKIAVSADFIDKLIEVAKANPDKQKDDAASLGTRIHAYIDAVITGKPLGKIDNDMLKPVMGFDAWWKSANIEILMGDTRVASLKHGYGGSLDALGYDLANMTLVLTDWKSSKGIWLEYALQVAAYCKAFEETFGIPILRAIIVRFAKDGQSGTPKGFEVAELRNIDESFAAFLAAKELQERMKFGHLIRD